MIRKLAIAGTSLIALVTLGTGCIPQTAQPGHISTINHPDGKCHEDDICWNCRTMGYHMCKGDKAVRIADGDGNAFWTGIRTGARLLLNNPKAQVSEIEDAQGRILEFDDF